MNIKNMNIPRPEFPRPQLVRDTWMNLNGKWDFLFDFGNSGCARGLMNGDVFDSGDVREITVPFCPESRLSGIGYTDFIAAVWYRRHFEISEKQLRGRVLLHFGAVDYRCVVWINGREVGSHRGGYSSFTVDITDAAAVGDNVIVVYAADDLRSMTQPYGKQSVSYHSQGCSYTRTTGIWQTVWLEFVPENYIESVKITPFPADGRVRIDTRIHGGGTLRARAAYGGKEVGNACAETVYGNASVEMTLDELHLWNVGKPELYDLELTLGDDSAASYFGMRSVELHPDGLYINGKPVFMRLILDQGFNPEGIYTAPSDEFLKRDIELSMELGFNGARLHQRVFEERSLYWADRLGYIVWGEYASADRLQDARGVGDFLPEWLEVLERDYSHPAIIGWCPENETYWRRGVTSVCEEIYYQVTKQIDPYRPVIDASGGVHYRTDMFDIHEYEQDVESFRKKFAVMTDDKAAVHNPPYTYEIGQEKYEGQPYWVSEYGGTLWNPVDNGWGYGTAPKTEEEFAERYSGLTSVLLEHPRICGFCYTQLTDIEQEQNGLYAYDRSRKFSDAVYEIIKETNTKKAAIEK